MIQNVFIENFKAIYRAANLPIQPFTVFIGNNGTGKSSIMEALKTLQIAIQSDLNEAFKDWEGLEKIRNYNAYLSQYDLSGNELRKIYEPIKIGLTALVNNKTYQYQVDINVDINGLYYVVEHEELICDGRVVFVVDAKEGSSETQVFYYDQNKDKMNAFTHYHKANSLVLGYKGSPRYMMGLEEFSNYIENWQFIYLNAHDMGKDISRDRVNRTIKLNYDGRNIAGYLLQLKAQGEEYLDSLLRKMHFVLPYIGDLQPHVLEETIKVELLLYEANERSKPLPGWLLSSGTLRILALLAMFETPNKPSVLFIDEIENGLDPRTIGLLLSEIEGVFDDKSMQVVVTTHSPYFLDLVPLESIIVAEKNRAGSTYHIPKDEQSLNLWKEKFSPGKLYTMGKLTN